MKYFILVLVIQYCIVALGYAFQKNGPLVLYWSGAAILTIGVLLIKE